MVSLSLFHRIKTILYPPSRLLLSLHLSIYVLLLSSSCKSECIPLETKGDVHFIFSCRSYSLSHTIIISISFPSLLFYSASRLRQMNPQLGVSSLAAFTAFSASSQLHQQLHQIQTQTTDIIATPTDIKNSNSCHQVISTPESLRSGLRGLINPLAKELDRKIFSFHSTWHPSWRLLLPFEESLLTSSSLA